MISISTNPWEDIVPGSERLVNKQSRYELLWGVEKNGDYALYIPITNPRNLPKSNISIKHLEIRLYESSTPESYIWVIILKNKQHWNIFKKLCEDLCTVSEVAANEKSMISHLLLRLKNWQELLSRDIKDFSLSQQMGLYSELKVLKDIIAPRLGLSHAVSSWVGGEKDKQDFLLDNCAIEVKSYRTSKGEIVQISSKEQLYTEKNYLYLISCALTKSETGDTVSHLVSQIKEELKIDLDFNTIDLFENKLINYGYSSVLIKEEDLSGFILDRTYVYHVDDQFPKIISSQVPSEIISVKYELDLSSCKNFIVKQTHLLL
ncbi:hypothetical protein J6TS1_39760 [Siminovitchia terrae]|uniref:PD-(D/E)XK motif protein n=2 Tax=Siminovitchia terrae TaxID=1914933 RepID=A0ABQ4L1P9_SIMTE|nr:hypothetical protein J6TS1_39760 [Siminovitchia terrae]